MNDLQVDCGIFQIRENENQLYLTSNDKDRAIVGLWGVLIVSPFSTETHYVLASTEDRAIGQARCVAKCESYHLSEKENNLIICTAKRLPMAIQGWSRRTF